ncbi:related to Nicotinamide riboside kinase [Hanseniaspora guilliermondii]|uniref:Related to Nicotinamide riboside kinase n=1 Tax=Hanseniaspora guilliermondii TaxID=56406 RepID=A0A1L0B567_9ASCO|nr:related to Nicotinamide riboside kinase [Hanseniaspora guilliermondii]
MLLVGCSGCSSSGKTTIVKILKTIIQEKDNEFNTNINDNLVVLHEDDFFKTDRDIPIDPIKNIQNWDCPEALNLDLFKQELRSIRETKSESLSLISDTLIHNDNVESLDKFHFDDDFKNKLYNEFKSVISKYQQKYNTKSFYIFLIDGFMMFHDNSILDLLDIKLFFRAPYEVLKSRREKRNYTTLEGNWVDPPGYFDDFVYKYYKLNHEHLFEDGDVENGTIVQKYEDEIILYENGNKDAKVDDILIDIVFQLSKKL